MKTKEEQHSCSYEAGEGGCSACMKWGRDQAQEEELRFLEELNKFYGYDPKMNDMIKERIAKLKGEENPKG